MSDKTTDTTWAEVINLTVGLATEGRVEQAAMIGNIWKERCRLREALRRISKMHPSGPGAGNVAREALQDG